MASRASGTSSDSATNLLRGDWFPSAPQQRPGGFTIVELLIVIVLIAILAAITIVAYNGISKRAIESSMQADLHTAASVLGKDHVLGGTYPVDLSAANGGLGLVGSGSNVLTYVNEGADYCLSVTNAKTDLVLRIRGVAGTIENGPCGPDPIADGSYIQEITSANCPTTRTRAVDARDNRTYWVQNLADGKCWMLTNLAYAGGGANTYSDVKTLTNGTGGSATYTVAAYYVSPNANPTTEPTDPSTSTDGGATSPQYGYLYNWCGAMGGQATAACAIAMTPAPNTTISICPSGWRLPTGNGGEFGALNTAVNGGATNTDIGLRADWLAQKSGTWWDVFDYPGTNDYYWSSTQYNTTETFELHIASPLVYLTSQGDKSVGSAVRCVAS